METPRSGTTGGQRNNGNLGTSGRAIDTGDRFEMDELRERFGELTERAAEFIKARPGTALLVAAGAGFLIGRILRS